MINAEQIRAARALLDWSTAELAQQTGLTVNGINKIERGHVQPHTETLSTLQQIFEAAGIEFLPNSGLRRRDRIVTVIEQADAHQNLLNDIYSTLKEQGGEVLIAHVDETLATSDLSSEFLDKHIQRLTSANITERMLICEGDKAVVTHLEAYRTVPKQYFITTPMFIYGEKLALLSWRPMPRAVILNDAQFAESARKLFNFIWDRATPLQSQANK